jgi:ketosteroid isomerase-like protein
MTTNREAAEIVYARFVDPTGGREAGYDVLHDDVVFECPFYDSFVPKFGRVEVEAMMRRMDEGAESFFAEQRFPSQELIATTDPNRFIIEVQGDHRIRSTGNAYRNHYFHCLTFDGGEIVRWVEYSNSNEFERASSGTAPSREGGGGAT